MVTTTLVSCSDSVAPIAENVQLPTVSQKAIEYPFVYIDRKKEDEVAGYNEMLLYECGAQPNPDTLRMFCADKKKEFSDGIFHIIVFFDKKQNAVFPNNPVTAFYIDEKPMKHIKAAYTYNRLNGYSKLECYSKNSYQSVAQEIEIE